MSDYEKTLLAYRAEIAALETNALALREAWVSADYETQQLEADRLDEEARGLRLSLVEIMRSTFNTASEEEEEVEADEPDDEADLS